MRSRENSLHCIGFFLDIFLCAKMVYERVRLASAPLERTIIILSDAETLKQMGEMTNE